MTDEAVILEVVVTGTHKGQWRELPPLDRRMVSRVCTIYTFDDEGLLELERTYYDKAIVLEQLGHLCGSPQAEGPSDGCPDAAVHDRAGVHSAHLPPRLVHTVTAQVAE